MKEFYSDKDGLSEFCKRGLMCLAGGDFPEKFAHWTDEPKQPT